MSPKNSVLMSIILILLIQPMLLFGQNASARNEWSGVISLPTGTSLRVETKSKKKIDGTLNNVSDTAITLLSDGKTESIDRSDVKKVYKVGGGSRGKTISPW